MMNYKHFHKMPISGKINRKLEYGTFGLKFLENGELNTNHLDLIKKSYSSTFRKYSKCWFRLQKTWPKYSRALGSRMGTGKSPINRFCYKINKGIIFFEWTPSNTQLNSIFLKKLSNKLPLLFCFVAKGL